MGQKSPAGAQPSRKGRGGAQPAEKTGGTKKDEPQIGPGSSLARGEISKPCDVSEKERREFELHRGHRCCTQGAILDGHGLLQSLSEVDGSGHKAPSPSPFQVNGSGWFRLTKFRKEQADPQVALSPRPGPHAAPGTEGPGYLTPPRTL